MGEFTDIMKQAKRMCETQKNCLLCPLYRLPESDGECALDCLLYVDFDEMERKIRAWAEKHPDNDSNVAHIRQKA